MRADTPGAPIEIALDSGSQIRIAPAELREQRGKSHEHRSSGGGSISIASDHDYEPPNSVPVAEDDSYFTLHDQAISDDVSLNDDDLDGDQLSFSLLSGPSSGDLTFNSDGTFVFVPEGMFVGQVQFTYEASDGTDTDPATVYIDMYNSAPVAEDDSFFTLHDQLISDDVSVNDYDPDGDPLTFSLVSGPSSGDLTFNSDGTFQFTPESMFVGQVEFTYEASDGIDADQAIVTIDVYNNAPVTEDDSYFTVHDQAFSDDVSLNDYDPDGDALTFSLVSGPSTGDLTFNSDGTFQYTPEPLFVGQVQFTYLASDGIDADQAVAIIDVYNSPPFAEDDALFVSFDPLGEPVILPVTDNDSDPDGDPIRIIDVSATAEGGTAWIDSTGLNVLYLPPPFPQQQIQIGGVFILDEDPPTSDEPPGTDGGDVDAAAFEDSFTYTISDSVGAMDDATVQVVMQNEPQWKMHLKEAYNEASEIGIDGEPGYDLEIQQTLGEAAPVRIFANAQTWQKNEQNLVYVYVDKDGATKKEFGKGRILADTSDLQAADQTVLRIDDQLGFATGTNVDKVALIIESVKKTLGLNKVGAKLPVPPAQPWRVTRQDHKDLLDQMNSRFGTLQTTTTYLFIDKVLLNDLHNQGEISDAVFDGIKQQLQGFGLNWETLPDKYEGYRIEGLGSWQFPAP